MRLSSSPSFWLGREQRDDADADSAANDHLLTLLFADERMGFSEGCGFRQRARRDNGNLRGHRLRRYHHTEAVFVFECRLNTYRARARSLDQPLIHEGAFTCQNLSIAWSPPAAFWDTDIRKNLWKQPSTAASMP